MNQIIAVLLCFHRLFNAIARKNAILAITIVVINFSPDIKKKVKYSPYLP